MAQSEFVEIVRSLREAERAIPESDSALALFEARRAEILAEHGVSEEDLQAFLRSRRDDVEALQETWDTISERLRYVPGADTLPSDTLPADTLPSDTLATDSVPGDTMPTDPASSGTVRPRAVEADTVRAAAGSGSEPGR